MSLEARLLRRVETLGPMTVPEYVWTCLHDPEDGYYARRPALGAAGDFVTAPEISQMFGELIGVWAAALWERLGAPERLRITELGPGTGALMSDLARGLSVLPGARSAARFTLVETSAPLRRLQAQRLADLAPLHVGRLSEAPLDAPEILIANEVFDCLPARQFVRLATGWAERLVGARAGRLAFGLAPIPEALIPEGRRGVEEGDVVEVSEAQAALAREITDRVLASGGSALIVDYGPETPQSGDTLQALRAHRKVDPLEAPGQADLTMHVDFPALVDAARSRGARARLRRQGELLIDLGVDARVASLSRTRPDLETRLKRQRDRLVADGEMGALFKALCVSPPDFEAPAFEAPALAEGDAPGRDRP